jgi:hypothetical protein
MPDYKETPGYNQPNNEIIIEDVTDEPLIPDSVEIGATSVGAVEIASSQQEVAVSSP